jgi:hypothetical protein
MMQAQCKGQYIEDTSAADEGRVAHDVAAGIIERASRGAVDLDDFDGSPAWVYARDVIEVMRSTGVFGGINLGIEKTLLCEIIHPLCYGTPDCWLYHVQSSTLYIWDFKHGRGWVEPFENWQLMAYAAGIMQLLGIDPGTDMLTIDMRIVQPKAFHPEGNIRSWKSTPQRLRPYIDRLSKAAFEVVGQSPKCLPGAHCRYCRARHGCDSERMYALDAVDAKAIDYHLTGLRARAEARIKRGEKVRGYSLRGKKGAMEWNQDTGDIAQVADSMGVDIRKPEALLTPLQAIDAGMEREVVEAFSRRKRGAVKLVRDDGTAARKKFSQ